jgi:hypothetical protein
MRKIILKATGYLHTTLFLALIIQPIFLIAGKEQPGIKYLYWISLLLLIPAAATERAVARCKGLGSYLLVSLAASAATGALVWVCAKNILSGGMRIGYGILLGAEMLWIVTDRLMARVRERKQEKEGMEYGADEAVRRGLFEKPRAGIAGVFVGMYVLGLLAALPLLCDEALGSLIVYFFLLMLHQFVEETEDYLGINHRVKNVPSRRIYGINGVFCMVFLAGVILVAVASVLTAGDRRYLVLEEKTVQWEPEEIVWQEPEIFPMDDAGLDAMFPDEEGTYRKPPAWLDDLAYVVLALAAAGGAVLLIGAIRELFARFREQQDENGDVVEELKEAVQEESRLKKTDRETVPSSERERIRRRYKKTIRKHRKGAPAPHETPYEMETAAKIADTAEGRALHALYEKARYGEEE